MQGNSVEWLEKDQSFECQFLCSYDKKGEEHSPKMCKICEVKLNNMLKRNFPFSMTENWEKFFT